MEDADATLDQRRWQELKRRSLQRGGLGADVDEEDDAKARHQAWLYVLDLEDVEDRLDDLDTSTFVTDAEAVDVAHKDEEQVALDVRRSFIWLGDTPERAARRTELTYVINGVLRRHPALRYYQGYHDVVSVLLCSLIPSTVLHHDEGQAAGTDALNAVVDAACRISLHVLRDAMTETMTPTMGHLKVLRNIVRALSAPLSRRIELASALPYFALPWILSVFAHDLDVVLSCRMLDYVLLRGPKALLFVCAALVERLDEPKEDEDGAELHQRLSRLPSTITLDNLSALVLRAEQIASTLNDDKDIGLHEVMGEHSTLSTWATINWQDRRTPSHDRRQRWSEADELASNILSGKEGCKDVVRDALPSPPAVDDDNDEEKDRLAGYDLVRTDKTLLLRRWWKGGAHRQGETRGALVAWIGAFGALGAAMLLMYGSQVTNSTVTSGLGTAFPVGLRASSETLRQVLRYALPSR